MYLDLYHSFMYSLFYRQKYVDSYIDFVFNKSVESQFRKFEEGFSRGNPFNFWRMFKPEELRDLLYGMSKYDWEELQKVRTVYIV